MKARTKYRLIKYLGILSTAVIFFGISAIFTLAGAYDFWKDIPEEGINTFSQWITIVFYRLLIYFLPPLFLSIFTFDRRYKWISRFIIWLNWCLCLFIITKAAIVFFALDKLPKFDGFLSSLDSFVILAGYLFTFIQKEPISFDSSGAIIDRNLFKEQAIAKRKGRIE